MQIKKKKTLVVFLKTIIYNRKIFFVVIKWFVIVISENVKPFHATGLFWNPLKTSENQRFSWTFSGCIERAVTWDGLNSNLKLGSVTLISNFLQKGFIK